MASSNRPMTGSLNAEITPLAVGIRCRVATSGQLSAHGVIPVNYGEDLADRLRAASPTGRVNAFIDLFGGGYVAIAVDQLGIPPERVDTVIDFDAVEKFGVKVEGSAAASTATVMAELAAQIASGDLEIPIAGVFPLARVRDTYRTREERHSRGKIVLSPRFRPDPSTSPFARISTDS